MTRVSTEHAGRAVPRLHVVTDDRVLTEAGFVERAEAVLRAGGRGLALHLRGPGTDARTVAKRVEALGDAAQASGARLLVNDRVDLAMAFPAVLSGVHLRSDSLATRDARALLPEALLGRSVHGVEEARGDDGAAADYLVLGTVWATPSHPGRAGAGLALVREVAYAVGSPVVAIGGVTVERVEPVLAAGGHGAAVLRAVWHATDPAGAVRAFLRALEDAVADIGAAAGNEAAAAGEVDAAADDVGSAAVAGARDGAPGGRM